MTELTDMLGMDAPSLSQRSRFDAFDSMRWSMLQFLHGASSVLDVEFWTADGVQAAIDGPPKDEVKGWLNSEGHLVRVMHRRRRG